MKISIITVNLNNASGLEKTILSVIGQTDRSYQFIIVDGGSNDDSLKLMEQYKDSIDFIISEKDNGVYAAMNKGIKVSNGEYLLFLNSGDHFYNSHTIKNVKADLYREDIIYFNIEIRDYLKSWVIDYPKRLNFSQFYIDGLCHQSVFIKKSLFDVVGYYDEKLKIASDWKFFILAIFKYNSSYKKVDKILATYYLDGMSSNYDHSQERNPVLKEYFDGFTKDYERLLKYDLLAKQNRFRALQQLEKSSLGKKMTSFFFRFYLIVFQRKSYKKIFNE